MTTIIRYAVVLALCLTASASAASPDAARIAFKQVYQAIAAGQVTTETDTMRALRGYPLYPYLLFGLVRERLHAHPDEADEVVRAFLERYPLLAPSDGLRNDWLHSLARRGRWDTFLREYRPGRNRTLRCDAVVARIDLNRLDGLEKDALALWNVGYSQPRACDPVFDWLQARGQLTPAVIRSRLDLAMDAGHYGLASYLAKKLPEKDRAGILPDIALLRNPASGLGKLAREHDRHVSTEAVVSALYSRAISSPEATAKLLPGLASGYSFSTAQRQRVRGRIALGFALDRDPRALEWFARVQPQHFTATLRAWRIRAALLQGKWSDALRWIEALPASEAESARWQYWHARALAETGNEQAAQAIYKKLAGQRGYYGYLAAGRSKQEYQLASTAVSTDNQIQEQVGKLPGIIRAHELFAVGLTHFARAEWRQALATRSDAERLQAALLASQWGWYSQSIRTLVRGGGGADLALRYPTAFSDTVSSHAGELALKPAWVYAVMRSESLFQPDARSPAGAIGLMQLMPGTARQVATRRGIDLPGLGALLDPDTNISLGSGYLQRMMARFDGNMLAATAAYNAGPNRVAQWLPQTPLAADVWVENIPYSETRQYVQRVVSFTAIFEWRLNRHVRSPALVMRPLVKPGPETIARAE